STVHHPATHGDGPNADRTRAHRRRAGLAHAAEAMTLHSCSRLGPYEIVALIGAGGMGEVYRAKDSKLGRDVALKVLPETFVNDPERLARFRREAQVLASLNPRGFSLG